MLFIWTTKDVEPNRVRIDAVFRRPDGAYFVLLHRMPPPYAKHPIFLAEVTNDTVKYKDPSGENEKVVQKAYVCDLNDAERKFLGGCGEGVQQMLLLGLKYPNVTRSLGKSFVRVNESEIRAVMQQHVFALTKGRYI